MSDIKCEICNGNKEDENNNTLCGACTQQIENGAREAVEGLETTDEYDTRLFVNSLPAYCECSVCHGAVRDPVQIEDCGHVFCASCLQTWIDRQDEPTCPNDRVVITNSFTDRSMRRVVMAMQVKCDHDQCLWKGDLHDRIEHLNRNCQHIKIRCIKDRCESVLARYELIEHIINFCIYRSCNCLYCNQSVMFCETENHYATDCEMFPIDCQYNCQQKIPRRQLAAHENDCIERPLLCSFHCIGCLFQGKKSLLVYI